MISLNGSGMSGFPTHPQHGILKKHIERCIQDIFLTSLRERADDLIYVFDNDELFYTSENSKEEFMGFLEGLTQEQFTQITNFFESLPTISHDLVHNCQKCNFEHKLHMEGLTDFFI
jgi:hypothetical protein